MVEKLNIERETGKLHDLLAVAVTKLFHDQEYTPTCFLT